jgi:hypothetical protein
LKRKLFLTQLTLFTKLSYGEKEGLSWMALFDDNLSWIYKLNEFKSQLQVYAKYEQDFSSSKRKRIYAYMRKTKIFQFR